MIESDTKVVSGLWLLLASALVVLCAGCSSDSHCKPAASECLGTSSVRVCPSDGAGWAVYGCNSWEVCKAGACVAADGIPATCTAGTGTCLTDKVVSLCVASGLAPAILACGSGETCNAGACAPKAPCVAAATQCVSSSLMRTCSADGLSWVPSACAANEICDATTGACAPNPAGCTPADDECLGGVPYVCKRDGSGFDTTPCPTGTHCVADGRCQGNGAMGCVVGTSCNGELVVSCPDGKSTSYTACAVQHLCVVDPATRQASCKPRVCSPNERACGNKSDLTADQSAYVSVCRPDASGWAVARCETGALCKMGDAGPACSFDCTPGQMACSKNSRVTCGATGKWDLTTVDNCGAKSCGTLSDNSVVCIDPDCWMGSAGRCTDNAHFRPCQGGKLGAAVSCPGGCLQSGSWDDVCTPACTDGETRCVVNTSGDSGFLTCASGKWSDVATMTVCSKLTDPQASKRCISLSDLVGAQKAVCGDGICDFVEVTCTGPAEVRYCHDGNLQPAQACPAGSLCYNVGCFPGGCAAGESFCRDSHSFVTCVNGQLNTRYQTCPVSATTGLQTCVASVDAAFHSTTQCVDQGIGCNPGDRRCTGSLAGVEICGADRMWTTSACVSGRCDPGGARCTSDCKPSQALCGGIPVVTYGQGGWAKSGACSATGLAPDWATIPDCSPGTFCRLDPFGAAQGCIECLGKSKTNNGFVDTKCTTDLKSVVFCADDNTWASDTNQQSCGLLNCVDASSTNPATCQ